MAAPLWNPSVYYKDQDANEIQGIEIHGSNMESCCAAVQFLCDHVCFKLEVSCRVLPSLTMSYLSCQVGQVAAGRLGAFFSLKTSRAGALLVGEHKSFTLSKFSARSLRSCWERK